MNKRVVQIIPSDSLGGVQSAANSISREDAPGFQIVYLNKTTFREAFSQVINADVAIFSLWKSYPLLFLLWLINKFRIRRVVSVVFLHSTRNAHWLDALLTWFGIRLADHIFADSEATKFGRIGKKFHSRVHVVSMRLGFFPEAPIKEQDTYSPKFIYWGRIHPVKNLGKSIEYVLRLHDNGVPNVAFKIIGSGNSQYLAELKSKYSGAIEKKLVRFEDEMKHGDLVHAAVGYRFFLSTSNHEGFAMSVIEAMGMGLVPVIDAKGEASKYCKNLENSLSLETFEKCYPELTDERFARLSFLASQTASEYETYSKSFLAAIETI